MIDEGKLNGVESFHVTLCFIMIIICELGNILQSEIGPLQISLLWDNDIFFLYAFFS